MKSLYLIDLGGFVDPSLYTCKSSLIIARFNAPELASSITLYQPITIRDVLVSTDNRLTAYVLMLLLIKTDKTR